MAKSGGKTERLLGCKGCTTTGFFLPVMARRLKVQGQKNIVYAGNAQDPCICS